MARFSLRPLRHLLGTFEHEPLLWSAGAAAVLITVVAVLSHGRAAPAAPVQSLTGQEARGVLRVRVGPNPNVHSNPVPVLRTANATQTPAKTPAPAAASNPPPAPAPLTRGVSPLAGPLKTGYGWVFDRNGGYWYYHTSWDIQATAGTVVRSAFAGIVQAIEPDPRQGLAVVIQSADNLVATYAGLEHVTVKVGAQVGQGVRIGEVAAGDGANGQSGAVVEFSLRRAGRPLDPGTLVSTP